MSAEPLVRPTTPATPRVTATASRRVSRALLGLALVATPGCAWFTDFKQQPKVDPWESAADSIPPRGQPQGSVPVTGSLVPAWQVSYAPTPMAVDSMSGLANPVPADDRSLANGRKYYAVNCAVCHGDAGRGDGPVTKYGMPGINLLTPMTLGRTDGYIWGMIRNGRGLMPNYNRIEEMDRWDVVNYVRGLQGRLGRPVPTGPLAEPGVGGDALPGATRIGPTRPVPHWGDTRSTQTGAPGQRPEGAPATADTAAPATGGARPAPGSPTQAQPAGTARPAGAARPTDTASATPRGTQQ